MIFDLWAIMILLFLIGVVILIGMALTTREILREERRIEPVSHRCHEHEVEK